MVAEALPTTKRVELFSAKEFVVAALGVDDEAFVAHVAATAPIPLQREIEEAQIHHSADQKISRTPPEVEDETAQVSSIFLFSSCFTSIYNPLGYDRTGRTKDDSDFS